MAKENKELNDLDEMKKLSDELIKIKEEITKERDALAKEREQAKLDNLKIQEELENQKKIIAITSDDRAKDIEEANKTASKLKENLIKTKIPLDPQNKEDKEVTVMINGYLWQMKRGETIEIPAEVAHQLEIGGYI